LFLPDTADAPKLHSHLNNSQFLDAISGKGGKKKAAKRTAEDLIEISDDSDEEEDGEPVVS
jgi:DNA-directed RNA polymerase-3 subunit RPC5